MSTTTVTREHAVIDAARAVQSAITDLEVDKLLLAVEWVELHPGDEVDTSIEWGMRDLEIAGDGAPTIDEGAVAEFALAIGISTDSGRLYLGDAVELKYRLPRIWAKVTAGQVPVWKARKVAQATRSLPVAGAAFVDRALYFVLRKCSFAEIDRQVDQARAEFDPEEAERRRLAAAVATAAERARIARELHDVVTHHVTAIVVQADATQFVAESPEQVTKALTTIGGTGRRALTELRHLLDVLEATSTVDNSLESLIDQSRRNGQPIELIEEAAVPPGVGLVVYRIVQEGLTNAVKYAPGRPTVVRTTSHDGQVEVEVVNEAAETPITVGARRDLSGGRGINGLRERLTTLGGAVTAAELPDGRFRLHATVPTGSNP